MGNDIEIKDLDLGGTSFLPTKITDIDGLTEIYSLEDEFAKTKKNRNLGLYISIGFFFAIVIASAFVFSVFIQNQNKNVEINISEFEDLRLKEVIDSARSHENNLDLLLIKLEILKIDQRKEILQVRQKFYKQELNYLANNLNSRNIDRNLTQIRNAESKEIVAINNKYETQINAQTQEIETIRQQLAERKAKEEEGKKSSSVSNVDRLNELKMEQLKESNDSGVVALREYYEEYSDYVTALYNPTFTSRQITTILKSKSATPGKKGRGFHPVYQQEGIISLNEYQSIQEKSFENGLLIKRLQRIPFKNSVSPALKQVGNLSSSIESDYDGLLRRFANVLIYKNSVIDNYQNALNRQLRLSSENGFVVNAESSRNLHIHLNKMFEATSNTFALVFREDDEYIGRIRLTKVDRDDIVRARVVHLAKNKSIKPFDKILLEIN